MKKRGLVGFTDGLDMTVEKPVETVAPWAEESFQKAEKKGFSRTNLLDIVGTLRMRKILVKAGYALQDNDQPITYQEMIVILDRDSKFN